MKETLKQTKTISGLHRSLEYEKRSIDEAVVKARYLSSVMKKVEEEYGWKLNEDIWGWSGTRAKV